MFAKKAEHLKGIKKLDLKRRTNSFLQLAERLKNIEQETLDDVFEQAMYQNPWFTKANIQMSLNGLLAYLDEKKLRQWVAKYDFSKVQSKNIGVVMAGNIPLVGIHDLISVLLSGHRLVAKLSSQDEVLIKFIVNELIKTDPGFEVNISFVERLNDMDAVIATGSDNTARYFDYYFSKIPHIIRKNRTSVAVLNGNETDEDIEGLGVDIFSYFGLGCRNVSKLYLPKRYDLVPLLDKWERYGDLEKHHKYHNNYHYQRSIMLVNQVPHKDSGYVLLVENQNLVSPIGVLYYEYYENPETVKEQILLNADKIQCLVSNEDLPNKIEFGKAQIPNISDFADNIDTMDFLSNL